MVTHVIRNTPLVFPLCTVLIFTNSSSRRVITFLSPQLFQHFKKLWFPESLIVVECFSLVWKQSACRDLAAGLQRALWGISQADKIQTPESWSLSWDCWWPVSGCTLVAAETNSQGKNTNYLFKLPFYTKHCVPSEDPTSRWCPRAKRCLLPCSPLRRFFWSWAEAIWKLTISPNTVCILLLGNHTASRHQTPSFAQRYGWYLT